MSPDTLQWIPVSSSNLAAVAFDRENEILYTRFNNGAEYAYDGVPETLYNELMAAGSKGQFLNQKIKSYYEATRVN